MSLISVFNSAIRSVDQIGVLPWAFISWFFWFLLYLFYKSIFQGFLRRANVRDGVRERLVAAYWDVSFTAITIPFVVESLSGGNEESSLERRAISLLEMNIAEWFPQQPQQLSIRLKLTFVLLIGFYLNHVSRVSLSKGFKSFEFLAAELFTVFFLSTFALRCVPFGMAIICLVNGVRCTLELARLFYCLYSVYHSKFLEWVTVFLLGLHCLSQWVLYCNILPDYLISTIFSFNTIARNDLNRISSLILLNFALWGFFIVDFCQCISLKFYLLYTESKVSIENLLYDPNEEEKTVPLSSPKKEEVKCSVEKEAKSDHEKGNNAKVAQNMRTIYQTVKCSIVVKRKLARIRRTLKERKEQEESLNSNKVEINGDCDKEKQD